MSGRKELMCPIEGITETLLHMRQGFCTRDFTTVGALFIEVGFLAPVLAIAHLLGFVFQAWFGAFQGAF